MIQKSTTIRKKTTIIIIATIKDPYCNPDINIRIYNYNIFAAMHREAALKISHLHEKVFCACYKENGDVSIYRIFTKTKISEMG